MFLVVATPESDALREASYFVERLRKDEMPLAGLVVNRVQEVNQELLTADVAAASAQRLMNQPGDAGLTGRLLELHANRLRIRERQHHLTERFVGAHPGVALAQVPALAEDVHDLQGLREVGELLALSRGV